MSPNSVIEKVRALFGKLRAPELFNGQFRQMNQQMNWIQSQAREIRDELAGTKIGFAVLDDTGLATEETLNEQVKRAHLLFARQVYAALAETTEPFDDGSIKAIVAILRVALYEARAEIKDLFAAGNVNNEQAEVQLEQTIARAHEVYGLYHLKNLEKLQGKNRPESIDSMAQDIRAAFDRADMRPSKSRNSLEARINQAVSNAHKTSAEFKRTEIRGRPVKDADVQRIMSEIKLHHQRAAAAMPLIIAANSHAPAAATPALRV